MPEEYRCGPEHDKLVRTHGVIRGILIWIPRGDASLEGDIKLQLTALEGVALDHPAIESGVKGTPGQPPWIIINRVSIGTLSPPKGSTIQSAEKIQLNSACTFDSATGAAIVAVTDATTFIV